MVDVLPLRLRWQDCANAALNIVCRGWYTLTCHPLQRARIPLAAGPSLNGQLTDLSSSPTSSFAIVENILSEDFYRVKYFLKKKKHNFAVSVSVLDMCCIFICLKYEMMIPQNQWLSESGGNFLSVEFTIARLDKLTFQMFADYKKTV